MSQLPDTFPDLACAGYRHNGSGHCTACGALIEWFWTPKNRKMPFSLKVDLMISEDAAYPKPSMTRYEPHFVCCPKADQFRRKKA